MDAITELLSVVCGRGRCFVIDGQVLPLCQRCLGLYLGAAVTAGWLVARRLWRRGLPPTNVVAIQAAALLAAMLGGLHVVDAGPPWRLACGLWAGHVAMVWLVAGAGELRARNHAPWPPADTVTALAAILLLGLGAVAYSTLLPRPLELWVALALAGIACLAAAGIVAAVAAAGLLLPRQRVLG